MLTALDLPGMSGLELLESLEELERPLPVAVMTADAGAEVVIQVLRLGAVDCLQSPLSETDLRQLVERVVGTPAMRLRTPVPDQDCPDGLIIAGQNTARLVGMADKLHGLPEQLCLLEGEAGTGKELIARRIHHGGHPNRAGAFTVCNCADLDEASILATIMAPPAARPTLPGSGGETVLLERIDHLSVDCQRRIASLRSGRAAASLMRRRLIGTCEGRVPETVSKGGLQQDLFRCMQAGHLCLSPLRERPEEILPLARIFLLRIRQERGRGFQKLSSGAEAFLIAQAWPGNVGQLYEMLDQAAVLFDGAVLDARYLAELVSGHKLSSGNANASITIANLPPEPDAITMPEGGFDLDAWNRAFVAAALDRNDGSPVRTAAYLKLSRKVLYTLRKRYGLLKGRAV
jgi:DNA-binding NtrC family response regulator